jgi:hypothetical protein
LTHAADSSNDEGDVFADAHDGVMSPDSSTKRNAATDNLAVIAEGSQNEIATRIKGQNLDPGIHATSIPMTVVEKIDPAEPSHGDVPGTAAHEKRKADAVPDAILRAPSPGEPPITRSPDSNSPSAVPIPKTVVTKVDLEPRHGEVLGTKAAELRTEDATPDEVEEKGDIQGRHDPRRWLPSSDRLTCSGWPTFSTRSHTISMSSISKGTSPIAEDGGFGPMSYEDDDFVEDDTHSKDERNENVQSQPAEDEDEDTFGSDFDDFEEGDAADEFGDFDGSTSYIPSSVEEQAAPESQRQSTSKTTCPFVSRIRIREILGLYNSRYASKRKLICPDPPSQFSISQLLHP